MVDCRRRSRAVGALPLLALLSCDGQPGARDGLALPDTVTFSAHIAPIVFEHCAACHRPGGSAPSSLLSYDEVRRRGPAIAAVTATGYMPPWLPQPGRGWFANERRLDEREIALVSRWVEQGMPHGDPTALPPVPEWPTGWQLGEPDLVVQMPEPYTLAPGSGDVFRNFVIPVPVDNPRYVRTVELEPGPPTVVHHATLRIDRTPSSRRLDAQDPTPGYDGMFRASEAVPPGGFFLGWTPGKVPDSGRADLAWRLEPGTDLVLQLHLRPA